MLTFKSYINEARKNPHLNPKVPINWHISQHYEDARSILGTDIRNSFVSFTAVDKLGVNPGSRYDTPLGIYSYPSFYVILKTGEYSAMRNLPFAGEQPYVNVFSVKGNVINLSTMRDAQLMRLYRSMVDVFAKYASIKDGSREWKHLADFLEEEVFDAASYMAKVNKPGGRLWWATKRISEMLMDPDLFYTLGYSVDDKWKTKKASVSWNKLFREMGVDGCVDLMGDGIIHTSEPVQAVFFSKKPIKDVNRYYNKYSPEDVEKAESAGERSKMLAQMSEDEYAQYIEDNPSAFVPMTDEKIEEYGGSFPVPVQEKLVELHLQKGELDALFYDAAYVLTDIRPQFVQRMAKEYPQHLDILALLGPLTSEMVDDSTIKEFAGLLTERLNMSPKIAFESTGELVHRNPQILVRLIREVEISNDNYGNLVRYFAMVVDRGKFDAVDTLDIAENLVRRISSTVSRQIGDKTLTLTPTKVLKKIVDELSHRGVNSTIVDVVDSNLSGVFQED